LGAAQTSNWFFNCKIKFKRKLRKQKIVKNLFILKSTVATITQNISKT